MWLVNLAAPKYGVNFINLGGCALVVVRATPLKAIVSPEMGEGTMGRGSQTLKLPFLASLLTRICFASLSTPHSTPLPLSLWNSCSTASLYKLRVKPFGLQLGQVYTKGLNIQAPKITLRGCAPTFFEMLTNIIITNINKNNVPQ